MVVSAKTKRFVSWWFRVENSFIQIEYISILWFMHIPFPIEPI